MTLTAEEITDPFLSTYTRVPKAGVGVCDVCHGAPRTGYARCYSCVDTMRQVERPVGLVVPVSLSEVNGQLHHVLRSYKQDDVSPAFRDRCSLQIAALLHRFLRDHGDCIRRAADDTWDHVTVVPSTRGRVGTHPLETAINRSPLLRPQYRSLLGPGACPSDHNLASDEAFAITDDVEGMRVLLVDDTFTSGARAQSAASSLQRAGARVVAIVPVARVVNGKFSEEAAQLLKLAKGQQFDFGTCCLE